MWMFQGSVLIALGLSGKGVQSLKLENSQILENADYQRSSGTGITLSLFLVPLNYYKALSQAKLRAVSS